MFFFSWRRALANFLIFRWRSPSWVSVPPTVVAVVLMVVVVVVMVAKTITIVSRLSVDTKNGNETKNSNNNNSNTRAQHPSSKTVKCGFLVRSQIQHHQQRQKHDCFNANSNNNNSGRVSSHNKKEVADILLKKKTTTRTTKNDVNPFFVRQRYFVMSRLVLSPQICG